MRRRSRVSQAVGWNRSATPEPYYRDARFFVLHGEIVFANFALLEAMARGVVPIASAVEGADKIVVDGENGVLYAPTQEGLVAAIHRALNSSDDQWRQWSVAARHTIERGYSLDA